MINILFKVNTKEVRGPKIAKLLRPTSFAAGLCAFVQQLLPQSARLTPAAQEKRNPCYDCRGTPCLLVLKLTVRPQLVKNIQLVPYWSGDAHTCLGWRVLGRWPQIPQFPLQLLIFLLKVSPEVKLSSACGGPNTINESVAQSSTTSHVFSRSVTHTQPSPAPRKPAS